MDNLYVFVSAVTGTFALTEELLEIDAETPLTAVFTFAYFGYVEETVVDARFVSNLPLSDQEEIFGASNVYDGSLAVLLSFEDVFSGSVFTTSLSTLDWPFLVDALTAAWTEVDASLAAVEITIQREEEYLSTEGRVYYVILYSVTLEGRLVTPSDLAPLPMDVFAGAFAGVTQLSGYTLVDISVDQLRRFALAVTFQCDVWISRPDREDLLDGILATYGELPAESQPEGVTLDYATQVFAQNIDHNSPVSI